MQAQLQEPRASNSVLNYPQAAYWRDRRRTLVIGEEIDVVVGRVEIGMVEHIEGIGFKAQAEALLDGELLGQAHIEAHLERTAEQVPARSPKHRFPVVASGSIAGGDAIVYKE